MIPLHRVVAVMALLLAAALFGFFYAWVCSTMWGLDRAAPEVAIAAMQAMNASVRNAVFAPAFFGSGPALLLAAVLLGRSGLLRAAALFAAAGALCLLGAVLPTMLVNVPMNEALAQVRLPLSDAAATRIWDAYSPRWQGWNTLRFVAMGGAVLLAGLGLGAMSRPGATGAAG